MSERMTLEPGRWYGWTMWPGYSTVPYHSPIRVEALHPQHRGNGRFDLQFINAAYAHGVGDMTYALRMMKRGLGYLLAAVENSDQAVCIERLSLAWLEKHMPDADLPFGLFRDCAGETEYDPIATWLDANHGGGSAR